VQQFSIEVRDFSVLQSAQGSSAHSLSCLTSKKALSSGVKRPGHEVDRSHSPTAQYKVATVLYIILLLPVPPLLLLLLLLLTLGGGGGKNAQGV